MKQVRKNEAGFTLIELLVVVIIVAILVAVGLPLLQGNVARAKLTEADAGLGTLRTAMRSYYAEHGNYTIGVTPLGWNTTPADFSKIGIRVRPSGNTTNPGDLDGRFFSQEAYSLVYTTANPPTFCATVNGTNSVQTTTLVPRANEVNGTNGTTLNRSMDHLGHLYNAVTCTAGTEVN